MSALQRPDATRVAGFWKWKDFGRSVKKGEKGIRILAPIVGVVRKPDAEAEKDITKQNTRKVVGFRNTYVFDVSQTEGVELPARQGPAGMWVRIATVFCPSSSSKASSLSLPRRSSPR